MVFLQGKRRPAGAGDRANIVETVRLRIICRVPEERSKQGIVAPDRVICADCLKKLALGPKSGRTIGQRIFEGSAPVLGLLAAWLFFYLAGRALLLIPVAVHDGTVWSSEPGGAQK